MLGVYFYVFMEWLFFVTKPSVFAATSFWEAVSVLLAAPLLPSACALVLVLSLAMAIRIYRNHLWQRAWLSLARAIPALIVSSCFFLLVDNFTYTLFGVGVISSTGIWRSAYGLLFLAIFALLYRWFWNVERTGSMRRRTSQILAATSALLIVSLCTVAFDFLKAETIQAQRWVARTGTGQALPNIFLFGADGLNADHMAAYGYVRDNTPFINQIMKEALVVENSFTNCSTTACSTTSMLTGKLPTEIKLFYAPDILRGKDAYQHLPGILKMNGYRTISLGLRLYADPYDSNMLEAFDRANFRNFGQSRASWLPKTLQGRFEVELYFLTKVYERVAVRLLHSFWVKPMGNPYAEVTRPSRASNAEEKMADLMSFIDEAEGPVFAHLHLLVTHGPLYAPRTNHFRKQREQTEKWMVDFRDDAILDVDMYFKQLVDRLKQRNQLENSILVLYTDHGQRFRTDVRLPLMFRFPKTAVRGRLANNAQVLDVAPTLLDYLGIERPPWMEGESLLNSNMEKLRPIFSLVPDLRRRRIHRGIRLGWTALASPYLLRVREISAVICHRFFTLEVRRPRFSSADVPGHTSPCDPSEMPSDERVEELLLDHLEAKGFGPDPARPLSPAAQRRWERLREHLRARIDRG